MTVSIRKVADLFDDCILVNGSKKGDGLTLWSALVNLDAPHNGELYLKWRIDVSITENKEKKIVNLDIDSSVEHRQYVLSKDIPIFIDSSIADNQNMSVSLFRNKFYFIEPSIKNEKMLEEAILRVKGHAYAQESEITGLKSYVANMEAAIAYQNSPSKRVPIPDDVKLLVWARDGGTCTRCGANQQLHFDHIIPVAKGGGNLAENIQLLCQTCNSRKSDRIAF